GGGATSAVASASVRVPAGGSPVQARRIEPQAAETPAPVAAAGQRPGPQRFAELVALFETKREGIPHRHRHHSVPPNRFQPGQLTLRGEPAAPRNLNMQLKPLLERWTGRTWHILMDEGMDGGAPTLSQQAHLAREAQKAAAAADPLVDAILQAFPGATIE